MRRHERKRKLYCKANVSFIFLNARQHIREKYMRIRKKKRKKKKKTKKKLKTTDKISKKQNFLYVCGDISTMSAKTVNMRRSNAAANV